MMLKRTGDEPVHARSPLRMRFWLALWGLMWMIAATVFFLIVGHPGWAAFTAALAAITAVDAVLVVRHMRQGPHFQPGRDIPPYEPAHDEKEPPSPSPSSPERRRRRL